MDRAEAYERVADAYNGWAATGSYEFAARLFMHAEYIATALHDDASECTATSEAQVLDEIISAAQTALGAMMMLGAKNWHFRGRLNEKPAKYAPPEVMTQPLRRYAFLFLYYTDMAQTKDATVCLEIYVVALEHLYDVLGGGELHEALVRGLDNAGEAA